MLSATQILDSMLLSVTEGSGKPIYAILPRVGPVSFFSQQRRAFNLIAALDCEQRLTADTRIAVVGGGLAGVTAAAAAKLLGANVTLFEENEATFHQQKGNHSRFIHPYVVEWPNLGADLPITDLPFLNWTAGICSDVLDEIIDQTEFLNIDIRTSVKVRVESDLDGIYIVSSAPFISEKFDHVIVTVGFGAESKFGLQQNSYWSDDDWHQLLSTQAKTILVSGVGDGGLIDVTRLALLQFDHGEVLDNVMHHGPLRSISDELLRCDEEMLSLLKVGATKDRDSAALYASISRALHQRYRALKVAELVPPLQVRRNYNKIILNSSLPTPLSIRSSIINRVIVHALVSQGHIQYQRGTLMKFPRGSFNGTVRVSLDDEGGSSDVIAIKNVDEVIIRHGPIGALEGVVSSKIARAFGQRSSAVDQVGREDFWRGSRFVIPQGYRPKQGIAEKFALRSKPSFERWLRELGINVDEVEISFSAEKNAPSFVVYTDEIGRRKLENYTSFGRISVVASTKEPDATVSHIQASSAENAPADWRAGNTFMLETCHIISGWDVARHGSKARLTLLAGNPDRRHPDIASLDFKAHDLRHDQREFDDADDFTTSILGLIGGRSKTTGYRGVAQNIFIDVYNVISKNGSASSFDLFEAIDAAIENRTQVILIPFFSTVKSEILEEAIDVAVGRGITVVTGIGDTEQTVFPAALDNCIAVCGSDLAIKPNFDDRLHDYLWISAPGLNVLCPAKGGGYSLQNGSSYSAAIVASLIATLYGLDPTLNANRVKEILKNTLTPLSSIGRTEVYLAGVGLLNAWKAISTTIAAREPLHTFQTNHQSYVAPSEV